MVGEHPVGWWGENIQSLENIPVGGEHPVGKDIQSSQNIPVVGEHPVGTSPWSENIPVGGEHPTDSDVSDVSYVPVRYPPPDVGIQRLAYRRILRPAEDLLV